MKVAIIGTGNMASGLANALAGAKHEVVIGSRDPAKAAALAEKIGQGTQGGGLAAATKLAEVVILAIPFGGAADAINEAGDLAGKVLIDISNPISADYKSLVIGHTTSAAEEIQALATFLQGLHDRADDAAATTSPAAAPAAAPAPAPAPTPAAEPAPQQS